MAYPIRLFRAVPLAGIALGSSLFTTSPCVPSFITALARTSSQQSLSPTPRPYAALVCLATVAARQTALGLCRDDVISIFLFLPTFPHILSIRDQATSLGHPLATLPPPHR